MTHKICVAVLLFLSVPYAHAEVVSSSASHYKLKHTQDSKLTPEQVWEKLTEPSRWWHPDHTYSGNSEHLSLKPVAGGYWREDWDGNSVIHGTVLYVKKGSEMRLDAPFGPLQDMAVTVIWLITIEAKDNGSQITFTETANGSAESKLDEIAPAVDYVKNEGIQRLAAVKDANQ